MSVKIYLPDRLRHLITVGEDYLEAEGSTAGECLEKIVEVIPRLEKDLFFKKGRLRSHIKVSVNEKGDAEQDLSGRVTDGDKIYLTMRKN